METQQLAYSSIGHSSSFLLSFSSWLHIHDLITFQVFKLFFHLHTVKPKEHSSPGFYLTLISSALCAGYSRLTVAESSRKGKPSERGALPCHARTQQHLSERSS